MQRIEVCAIHLEEHVEAAGLVIFRGGLSLETGAGDEVGSAADVGDELR